MTTHRNSYHLVDRWDSRAAVPNDQAKNYHLDEIMGPYRAGTTGPVRQE